MAALARVPVAELPGLIAQMFASVADANLFMSQSQLFSVVGNPEFALEMQARALQMRTVYRIAGTKKPSIRLLALMGAGEPSVNTPLDYLLENSDIRLDLLYIVPASRCRHAFPNTMWPSWRSANPTKTCRHWKQWTA